MIDDSDLGNLSEEILSKMMQLQMQGLGAGEDEAEVARSGPEVGPKWYQVGPKCSFARLLHEALF